MWWRSSCLKKNNAGQKKNTDKTIVTTWTPPGPHSSDEPNSTTMLFKFCICNCKQQFFLLTFLRVGRSHETNSSCLHGTNFSSYCTDTIVHPGFADKKFIQYLIPIWWFSKVHPVFNPNFKPICQKMTAAKIKTNSRSHETPITSFNSTSTISLRRTSRRGSR